MISFHSLKRILKSKTKLVKTSLLLSFIAYWIYYSCYHHDSLEFHSLGANRHEKLSSDYEEKGSQQDLDLTMWNTKSRIPSHNSADSLQSNRKVTHGAFGLSKPRRIPVSKHRSPLAENHDATSDLPHEREPVSDFNENSDEIISRNEPINPPFNSNRDQPSDFDAPPNPQAITQSTSNDASDPPQELPESALEDGLELEVEHGVSA
jgi:hypothetical protein